MSSVVRLCWLGAVLLCSSGCGDDDVPAMRDAGRDASAAVDAGGRDAATLDAATLDAGATTRDAAARDAATLDAALAPDAGGRDAGPLYDAGGRDAGNECVVRGGMCVAVVPGSCASGVYGDPAWCGSGVGVACCLPDPTVAPVCANVGTAEQGWYRAGGGALICLAHCAGATATCDAIGTRSEGWYSSIDGVGCRGDIGLSRLIEWTFCAP